MVLLYQNVDGFDLNYIIGDCVVSNLIMLISSILCSIISLYVELLELKATTLNLYLAKEKHSEFINLLPFILFYFCQSLISKIFILIILQIIKTNYIHHMQYDKEVHI